MGGFLGIFLVFFTAALPCRAGLEAAPERGGHATREPKRPDIL